MNTFDAIAARRSIRNFEDTPVPEEMFWAILIAGIQALSRKNKQHQWLGEAGEMIAAVSFGYPAEAPAARPRKAFDEVVKFL
jgi:nitroreductase